MTGSFQEFQPTRLRVGALQHRRDSIGTWVVAAGVPKAFESPKNARPTNEGAYRLAVHMGDIAIPIVSHGLSVAILRSHFIRIQPVVSTRSRITQSQMTWGGFRSCRSYRILPRRLRQYLQTSSGMLALSRQLCMFNEQRIRRNKRMDIRPHPHLEDVPAVRDFNPSGQRLRATAHKPFSLTQKNRSKDRMHDL